MKHFADYTTIEGRDALHIQIRPISNKIITDALKNKYIYK